MEKTSRVCRFVSISDKCGVHDGFQIEDGGTVLINGLERYVNYIDETHFMVGMRCFHIFEFFEKAVTEGKNIVVPAKGLITREYGSNFEPYKKSTYGHVSFPDLGEEVFEFSDLRIIRETLPLGMYAYDLRYDDEDGKCEACEIARHIMVNHLGTIISPVPLLGRDEKKIILNHDMQFVDIPCSQSS